MIPDESTKTNLRNKHMRTGSMDTTYHDNIYSGFAPKTSAGDG